MLNVRAECWEVGESRKSSSKGGIVNVCLSTVVSLVYRDGQNSK